jgi:hypothetical protein
MRPGLIARLRRIAPVLTSAARRALSHLLGLLATARRWWPRTRPAIPAVPRAERRRLGESLMDRRSLSSADLEDALEMQKATRLPLGEVLTVTGMVPAGEVAEALGEQLEMRAVMPDPQRVPRALLARLAESDAEALGLLPLAVDPRGHAVVAFSSEPAPEVCARVEQWLGCRIVPVLATASAIARARRQAYRRLLDSEDSLFEYRPVHPGDVDVELLRRLGYGFCAFYGLVPLRKGSERVAIASAFPLPMTILAPGFARLRMAPEAVLAPSLDVRVALAAAGRAAWPAESGIDGAELRTLAGEPTHAEVLPVLSQLARQLGQSPIDYLESAERLSVADAARLRAKTFGLALVRRRDVKPAAAHPGLLPPGLAERHDIHVDQVGPRLLVLASPRPTPRLAAEIAALFPTVAIAWEVLMPDDADWSEPVTPRKPSSVRSN